MEKVGSSMQGAFPFDDEGWKVVNSIENAHDKPIVNTLEVIDTRLFSGSYKSLKIWDLQTLN